VVVQAVAPGAGVPVGTVVLSEGTRTLGRLTLNGAGRANFTVKGLSKGTHLISASFSGSGNFQPGIAMVFKLTL
jgi:hypothetical protein